MSTPKLDQINVNPLFTQTCVTFNLMRPSSHVVAADDTVTTSSFQWLHNFGSNTAGFTHKWYFTGNYIVQALDI